MAGRKRKVVEDGGVGAKKKRTATAPATSMRITRNMQTDGPRKAVFNTAELLEAILLFVPMKTVFASQRVCRQFRDIVATSIKLQEHLFLRMPAPDQGTFDAISSQFAAGQVFKLVRAESVTSPLAAVSMQQAQTSRLARFNPLTGLLFPNANLWSRCRTGTPMRLQLQDQLLLDAVPSWRHMYMANKTYVVDSMFATWALRKNKRPSFVDNLKGEAVFEDITLGGIFDSLLDRENFDAAAIDWRVRQGDGKLREEIRGIEELEGKQAKLMELQFCLRGVVELSENELKAHSASK